MVFEDELKKHLSEKTRTIRYGNLIIKILNPNSDSPGMLVKNIEQPHIHYHIFAKDGKPYFLTTFEDATEEEKHKIIDIQKFQGELAKFFYDTFSKREKIELDDPRFVGKKIRFVSKVNLEVYDVNKKEITIGDNYEETLKNFENINEIQEDAFGVLLDDDGNESEILFLKSGDIYKLDLSSIEEKKFSEWEQN